MSKTKKIILVIVEGVTDESSLARIFTKIINNSQIKFYFTEGDITSDDTTTSSNLKRKLGDHIKNFLETNHFKKNDIKCVIHLLDTDGAYIDKQFIKEDSTCKNFYYTLEGIKSDNVNNVIYRNQRKSILMNMLSTTDKVLTNIDYRAYYLSSNLEHVLHDRINVTKDEKMKLADTFDDKYFGKETDFINFISDSSIAVSGEYLETWEYIKRDLNSLNRFSNLHLFFLDI